MLGRKFLMTTVIPRRASAIVSALSNPLFVSYPPTSAGARQTSEAVVLHGLTSNLVGGPGDPCLVSLSTAPTPSICRPTYRKRSGKRTLVFDVGNDLRTLKEILIPEQSYLPKPNLLRTRQLLMDEAYLHTTPCSWDTKSDLDRALIVASGMASKNTKAFTVDFTQARQKSLGSNLPQAFRKLRNELALLSRLGPTVVTLEHDPKGRLHLHGMVSSDVDHEALRAVLLGLGGRSDSISFRNCHQVDITPANFTLGWLTYITKTLIRLPDQTASQRIYMSSSSKLLGKGHLLELRRAAEHKLGIIPDWRGRAAVYTAGKAGNKATA